MNKTSIFLTAAGALALLAVVIGLPKATTPTHVADPTPRPTPVPVSVPTPAPKDGSLKMEARLSHPYITPGQSDVFLTVDLTGVEVPGAERAPVNLAVVIDRSGSMAGQKLQQAKDAAQQLIRQLKDSDRVTIIHFGSDVRELRALNASDENKATMRRFIAQIQDEGGTNIGAALRTAEHELQSGIGDYKINRIILMTDGQPTEGMTYGPNLVRLVQTIHGSGVTVTALGVGADFNEDLLRQFADYGAGSYGFMEDGSKLAAVFQRDLQQAATTVARNVELKVTLPPGTDLKDVLGYRFTREGESVRIPMTDFAAGQLERVVARLSVRAGQDAKAVDVAQVHVAYLDLLHNQAAEGDTKLASMVTDKREEVLARRDKSATVNAARAVAAQNYFQAADALEKGDTNGAANWVRQNENVFKDAESVAGPAAVADDRKAYAPPPAAFAATPPAEIPVAAKHSKSAALRGFGHITSTY